MNLKITLFVTFYDRIVTSIYKGYELEKNKQNIEKNWVFLSKKGKKIRAWSNHNHILWQKFLPSLMRCFTPLF